MDRFKEIREKVLKDKTDQELESLNTLTDIVAYVLDNMLQTDIDWIKGIDTVNSFMGQAHFLLGMSIRNHLRLWQAHSHLYNFFKTTYGLDHADDMSGIILHKLYDTIHGKDDDSWIQDDLAKYKAHWERENKGGNYTIMLNADSLEISTNGDINITADKLNDG